MATLTDILSPVWTLSIDGGGAIAEGIEAIKQCLNIIVRTTPGSDPLRPEFGCDLYKYVDYPLNEAIPKMKQAMLQAVSRWEPRIVITKVLHRVGEISGQIIFNLGYTLADGTVTDVLTVSVSSGGVNTGTVRQRLIIRAMFPENPDGLQIELTGQINGKDILPIPPVTGFASIADLFSWVKDNWSNYGQWYLTADSLVGYLNPVYISASVGLSVLSTRKIATAIPSGFGYSITVTIGGATYSNSTSLLTPGDILGFVQNDPTLGPLGSWSVATVLGGSFSEDFSTDFDTNTQELQLVTDNSESIQINITAD